MTSQVKRFLEATLEKMEVEFEELNPSLHLLYDLGLDSLMRKELAAKLDRKFGSSVSDFMEGFDTVGDLLVFLEQRVASGSTALGLTIRDRRNAAVTGKTALVTGGTRGIGRAIVTALGTEGSRVVFCGRSKEGVEATEQEMRSQGLDVHGAVADVRSLDDVRALVDFALGQANGKGVEILVNNAGRPGGGITAEVADELWDDVINTNLNSVFRVTREILRRGKMLERKAGRIINIASTGGKQGVAFGAPYSASKHGVVGFTKALGLELAKSGVTVNAVCPGFVETEMAQHVRQAYAKIWNCTPEEALSRVEMRIPTGRYVVPDEVAEMVMFLACTSAGSITGQAINVCGGLGNY